VKKGEPSDPYLIGFYDKKSVKISHNSKEEVVFTLEVEPIGHGPWMMYKQITVAPGKNFEHVFEDSFQARWIRFSASKDCEATTLLVYN
jgi:hypothetical protein